MYNRDRDLLIAETIERVLNRLEEVNQAELDEASLMRRAANTYRQVTGQIGDFTKGRFKNKKARSGTTAPPPGGGPAPLSGRKALNSLKELSPKTYYYYLDNSTDFNSAGYYTFDSFLRFPPTLRKAINDIVLPIPDGVDLDQVTAKSKTRAIFLEFRFRDLADSYSRNPKAIVARETELIFNMLTKKWDKVHSRSLTVPELVEYEDKLNNGELSKGLVKSYRVRIRKKVTGIDSDKYTRLGTSATRDQIYKGRYRGIDLADKEILKIPGMQAAFDKYSELINSQDGTPLHPSHSMNVKIQDWTLSTSFAELKDKITDLKGTKGQALPAGAYPLIVVNIISLTYEDIVNHTKVGKKLNPAISPIDSSDTRTMKNAAAWLMSLFRDPPKASKDDLIIVIEEANSYIPSNFKWFKIVETSFRELIEAIEGLGLSSESEDSESPLGKVNKTIQRVLNKLKGKSASTPASSTSPASGTGSTASPSTSPASGTGSTASPSTSPASGTGSTASPSTSPASGTGGEPSVTWLNRTGGKPFVTWVDPINRKRIIAKNVDFTTGDFGDIEDRLIDGNFEGANFTDMNLQGLNFEGSNLRNAFLQGADLTGAELQGVNLQGADLTGAKLQSADLTGAVNLSKAKGLDSVEYDENTIWPNKFDIVKYQPGVSGKDFRKVNFTSGTDHFSENEDLSGARFEDVNLRDVDFKGANLSKARLQRANFNRTDLKNVNLKGADLTGAVNLSRAMGLDTVKYDEKTIWPSSFDILQYQPAVPEEGETTSTGSEPESSRKRSSRSKSSSAGTSSRKKRPAKDEEDDFFLDEEPEEFKIE